MEFDIIKKSWAYSSGLPSHLWVISSGEERVVHIDEVAGSIPVSPTPLNAVMARSTCPLKGGRVKLDLPAGRQGATFTSRGLPFKSGYAYVKRGHDTLNVSPTKWISRG